MSLKKKLMLGLFKESIKHKGFSGYFKKIFVLAAVLGLVLLVGTVFVISYSINQVNNLFTDTFSVNIVALERLVSEKAVVLNEEQKTTIVPLLKQLVNQEQTPEQAKQIETEILGVLNNKQAESVLFQAEKIKTDADSAMTAGRTTIEELVNKYTGISFENGKNLVSSISGWWEVNVKNNNVPNNLLKEIEGSQ